ncbi:hypothetical protein ACJX0J_014058, partial [Zea mays]
SHIQYCYDDWQGNQQENWKRIKEKNQQQKENVIALLFKGTVITVLVQSSNHINSIYHHKIICFL